ncbi:hypothetical protein AHiyo8_46330 [Arthrobacter sp. Hiyo8]|uniref:hypothetical protein n=1 Tax=Arthrobacter sp. Hiyo1 TaxID=1588020 RepID=UPI0006839B9A|nr:hypothetical protein [Arthrobacter sp. Hiyo1]BAS16330.1 hypothetical protein AHiyo8_46330 [Arthrobacter sp. Hiyo8]GAP60583.1 hypothetical protein AHiyo1_41410 [Arthrobacter sp. Hiyo1]
MSGYYRQNNDLPQSYGPMVSFPSPEMKRLRSLRTTVGVSCLILTAGAGFYTGLDLSLLGRFGGASGMVFAASAAGYAVAAACYLGMGIWVLVTRKTTSKAPLIAAAAVAGIAAVLLLFGLVTSPAGNHAPQYGSITVNLLMLMRAVTALRIRVVPAVVPAARF